MGAVQALFAKGFAQIDQAKSIADEVGEGADVVEQIDSQPQQQQGKKKKKDKPTSLVQVATENKAESAASLYASAASAAKEAELLNQGQKIAATQAVEQQTSTDQLQKETDDLVQQAQQVLPVG